LQEEIVTAASTADASIAPARAGNAVGLIGKIEPAGDIVRRIAAEAEELIRTRPSTLLAG